MFAPASEFGSFLGQNSLDMTRFLIKMWDGEDYNYQLKTSKCTLTDPALTIIGGTTPSDIAKIMPQEAIGQGFMSRIILVFAPKKHKSVPPRHTKLKTEYETALAERYEWINFTLAGEMKETPEAAQAIDAAYAQEINLRDNRFVYYSERRHTHLLKLMMILAALRRDDTIRSEDVNEAVLILVETEKFMGEALGEFGLSPIGAAKQQMLEFIQHASTPVHEQLLWSIMQRDLKRVDFCNCLHELTIGNKIFPLDTKYGKAYTYNPRSALPMHDIWSKIAEEESNPEQEIMQ